MKGPVPWAKVSQYRPARRCLSRHRSRSRSGRRWTERSSPDGTIACPKRGPHVSRIRLAMYTFPLLFALAIIVTLVTGIWLLVHLTSVASLFSGKGDIVPSPRRPRVPRGRVVLVMVLFAAGLAATIGMQILAMSSNASALI